MILQPTSAIVSEFSTRSRVVRNHTAMIVVSLCKACCK